MMFKMWTPIKILILLALFSQGVLAQNDDSSTHLTLEGGALWQTRNDQRIPGNSGDSFSLSDFADGPFAAYRIYLGHRFSSKHEVRLLYAPLALKLSGRFQAPIDFKASTFAANTDTNAFYKFNSYRASYIYHLEPMGSWRLAYGFTAKIRDAEVRLEQGALRESKKNVGFVPLLHFQAHYQFADLWKLTFDMDGLAAPQGRAFDVGLFINRQFDDSSIESVHFGYRTIEGGADNDRVYNFAWIHIATLGLNFAF